MAESHTQTLHPKEEQHASPGGHLFSQVCSPNVIKIGAAHTPKQRCTGTPAPWVPGHGCETRGTVVLFWADGTDDENSTKRGRSKWRRKRGNGGGGLCEKSSYGLFTANNCLEKHNLRRAGLFGANADYPLLFDSQSVKERSHERIGGAHSWEQCFINTRAIPKWAKCSP